MELRPPPKLTKGPLFAISGAAVVLILVLDVWFSDALAAVLGYKGQLGMFALDMNLWPPQTPDLLVAYGSAGRRAMAITHGTLDLLFPLAYSVMLLNVVYWAGRRSGLRPSSLLLSIPLAAGLADLLENAGFIALAAFFPASPSVITLATGFFTWAKFVLIALSIGIPAAWLWAAGGVPRTRRKKAVVVVISSLPAAALTGVLFFGVVVSPRPSTMPGPPCAALLIVGLRGNGDPVTQDRGMGRDTRAVVDRISDRLSDAVDAAAVGFPYVTGPPPQIVGHVQAASRLLTAYVAERNRRCPAERLVLVGQSEGAAVVHLALPFVGSQLVAAVLLADPARLAHARYDDLGSANDGVLARLLLNGVGDLGRPVHDVLTESLEAKVRSYCLSTDPVCDPNWATELQGWWSHIHTSYKHNPGGIADRAADFITSAVVAGPGRGFQIRLGS